MYKNNLAAVSWKDNMRIYRIANDCLQEKAWCKGLVWSGWQKVTDTLPYNYSNNITAISWGDSQIRIYCFDDKGQLYQIGWSNGWTPWLKVGNPLNFNSLSITSVSFANNNEPRIYCIDECTNKLYELCLDVKIDTSTKHYWNCFE